MGVGRETFPKDPFGPGVRMHAGAAMGEVDVGGNTKGVPKLPVTKSKGVRKADRD